VLPFSPLADEAPDASADLCWLPGGYPELHAERLAGNRTFLAGLRRFAESKPVYGECGGYMVLGEELIDRMGRPWPMAGLLPVVTSFAMRKLHLGYRAVTLTADTPPGTRGQILRGHEFHYATVVRQGQAEPLGEGFDAEGQSLGPIGQCVGRVSGSFFHRIG
jgi:cobyrinic acid a,c-diamide synthase